MALADTTFDILLSLLPGPRHGYAMLEEIRKLHGGDYAPGPGLLYTTLAKLIKSKLIIEVAAPPGADPRRKYYQLTSLGSSAVRAELDSRQAFLRNAQALAGVSHA